MTHNYFISELPVLAVSDWKRAALFFDNPVLCCWFDHQGIYDASPEDPKYGGMKPGGFQSAQSFLEEFDQMLDSQVGLRVELVQTRRRTVYRQDDEFRDEAAFRYAVERASERRLIPNPERGKYRRSFYDEMERQDGRLGPMEYRERSVGRLYGDRYDAFRYSLSAAAGDIGAHDVHGWDSVATDPSSVDLHLAQIRLVDATKVSWQAIRELRADKRSVDDLRTLRRFVVSNMQGYPLSYIEDELANALRKHEDAARKWGLARGNSELSISIRSSTAIGILTAVGVVTSGSDLSTAIAIGASIPLAQSLLTIRAGREKLLGDSQVNYLVRLRRVTKN